MASVCRARAPCCGCTTAATLELQRVGHPPAQRQTQPTSVDVIPRQWRVQALVCWWEEAGGLAVGRREPWERAPRWQLLRQRRHHLALPGTALLQRTQTACEQLHVQPTHNASLGTTLPPRQRWRAAAHPHRTCQQPAVHAPLAAAALPPEASVPHCLEHIPLSVLHLAVLPVHVTICASKRE